ncbi:bacterial trigger factor family protein, partial [Bordetella holmesii 41130]
MSKAVEGAKLRVAGSPSLEPKTEGVDEATLAFSATFEVYPEVAVPDLSGLAVTRFETEVSDAEVNKTLDVLRKQRATYETREGRARKTTTASFSISLARSMACLSKA